MYTINYLWIILRWRIDQAEFSWQRPKGTPQHELVCCDNCPNELHEIFLQLVQHNLSCAAIRMDYLVDKYHNWAKGTNKTLMIHKIIDKCFINLMQNLWKFCWKIAIFYFFHSIRAFWQNFKLQFWNLHLWKSWKHCVWLIFSCFKIEMSFLNKTKQF